MAKNEAPKTPRKPRQPRVLTQMEIDAKQNLSRQVSIPERQPSHNGIVASHISNGVECGKVSLG